MILLSVTPLINSFLILKFWSSNLFSLFLYKKSFSFNYKILRNRLFKKKGRLWRTLILMKTCSKSLHCIADHITSFYLVTSFYHKFYLVHPWILCPKCSYFEDFFSSDLCIISTSKFPNRLRVTHLLIFVRIPS